MGCCFLKSFDAQVQPIVLYGAEIWGLDSSSSVIDNLHLFGLKSYLGVDRRTPNDLVYGEVGKCSLYKVLVKIDTYR